MENNPMPEKIVNSGPGEKGKKQHAVDYLKHRMFPQYGGVGPSEAKNTIKPDRAGMEENFSDELPARLQKKEIMYR